MGAHISVPLYQRSVPQRYRLEGQRCRACQTVIFPPKAACPRCGSLEGFDPAPLSGRGTIYAFSRLAGGGAPPEFAEEATIRGHYWVALVQLVEGPRILGLVIDPPEEGLRVDQPVEAVWRRIYSEEGVVRYGFRFRPAPGL